MELADSYWSVGLCVPAVPLYVEALALAPEYDPARINLVDCLLRQGRWREAERQAIIGASGGRSSVDFRRLIDRARAERAGG